VSQLISKANHLLDPAHPVPHEGRIAIVTDVGRDAVDAGGAADESAYLRTAKPCGPDTPTLVSSRRKRFRRRRWQTSPVTGESMEETVKTIAQGMPDVSGEPVVTNARAYYPTRAAAGASSARHSLCPLIFTGQKFQHNSGGLRREKANAHSASS
jgi:hypothetical protein